MQTSKTCKHKRKKERKPRKEGQFLPGNDQIRSSEQDPIEKEILLRLFLSRKQQ